MNRSDVAPRRVAVVGPTASGKSSVAMAAALAVGDVELVSIDSMQVYRGMDIGTATPSSAERDAVLHHLIDLVEPSDEFTVADFQIEYRRALERIADRHSAAVLVGGTGLYHRAVIDDLELPGQWPEARERLLVDLADGGPETLHARLVSFDPVAADRMEPTNGRRIVRALEVCEGSGRPFSSFGPGLESYPSSPVVQIGLRWDRTLQAARIEARVHRMMGEGLLDEVRSVMDGPGFSRTAAQALGYKELIDHLDGSVGHDEAVERIIVRTRQFAVRQLRWFRRDPRVRWVDVEHDPVAEVAPVVVAALTT